MAVVAVDGAGDQAQEEPLVWDDYISGPWMEKCWARLKYDVDRKGSKHLGVLNGALTAEHPLLKVLAAGDSTVKNNALTVVYTGPIDSEEKRFHLNRDVYPPYGAAFLQLEAIKKRCMRSITNKNIRGLRELLIMLDFMGVPIPADLEQELPLPPPRRQRTKEVEAAGEASCGSAVLCGEDPEQLTMEMLELYAAEVLVMLRYARVTKRKREAIWNEDEEGQRRDRESAEEYPSPPSQKRSRRLTRTGVSIESVGLQALGTLEPPGEGQGHTSCEPQASPISPDNETPQGPETRGGSEESCTETREVEPIDLSAQPLSNVLCAANQ